MIHGDLRGCFTIPLSLWYRFSTTTVHLTSHILPQVDWPSRGNRCGKMTSGINEPSWQSSISQRWQGPFEFEQSSSVLFGNATLLVATMTVGKTKKARSYYQKLTSTVLSKLSTMWDYRKPLQDSGPNQHAVPFIHDKLDQYPARIGWLLKRLPKQLGQGRINRHLCQCLATTSSSGKLIKPAWPRLRKPFQSNGRRPPHIVFEDDGLKTREDTRAFIRRKLRQVRTVPLTAAWMFWNSRKISWKFSRSKNCGRGRARFNDSLWAEIYFMAARKTKSKTPPCA